MASFAIGFLIGGMVATVIISVVLINKGTNLRR